MIKSYRDLAVWQIAMSLIREVYRLSNLLPRSETYGLASQMQRAAVSIACNIAEGHGRDHRGDYLRFLSIAKGALTELETLLLTTESLEMLSKATNAEALGMADRLGRMLRTLSDRLRHSPGPRPQPPAPTGRSSRP